MEDIRKEAKKSQDDKLRKYGADHKACGGTLKKFASGGKVEHSDKAEDEKLLHKELKPDAFKHRADGGSIAGGSSPKLGRGRKGGKGKTQVNIAIGKPGGGDGPALPPPPALGASPSPMPPKPPIAAPVGPRPMPSPNAGPGLPPGGPMKRGGKVEKKKH